MRPLRCSILTKEIRMKLYLVRMLVNGQEPEWFDFPRKGVITAENLPQVWSILDTSSEWSAIRDPYANPGRIAKPEIIELGTLNPQTGIGLWTTIVMDYLHG